MLINYLLITISVLASVESTILITQPALTGFTDNQISYWFANFGVVHYNKPMSLAIVVTNYSLCGETEESNLPPFSVPTYIVVKEGGCSFTTKSIQAQNKGAQGIMIGSREVEFADGNVVLSDDGNGRKVRITTLFIKPEDVDKLAALTNSKIKVNF